MGYLQLGWRAAAAMASRPMAAAASAPESFQEMAAEASADFPGWACAVAVALDLSQQDSEDTQIADACRVDSSSETSDEECTVSPSPGSGIIPLSPQSSDDAHLNSSHVVLRG